MNSAAERNGSHHPLGAAGIAPEDQGEVEDSCIGRQANRPVDRLARIDGNGTGESDFERLGRLYP